MTVRARRVIQIMEGQEWHGLFFASADDLDAFLLDRATVILDPPPAAGRPPAHDPAPAPASARGRPSSAAVLVPAACRVIVDEDLNSCTSEAELIALVQAKAIELAGGDDSGLADRRTIARHMPPGWLQKIAREFLQP